MSRVRTAALALTALLAACEDTVPSQDLAAVPDLAMPEVDLATPDLFTPGAPAPKPVPISATGHDRLLGVAFEPSGSFYAVGYVTSGTEASSDFETVVGKFNPDGNLMTTFGTGGFAKKNVAVGTNGEVARGIVVQSTGKIVVSGTVEHVGAVDARDRDTFVMRLNTDGSVDTTFGDSGVKIVNLSEGEVITGGFVADATYGLSLAAGDKLVMMSAQKRMGATDSDFALVRLTADGQPDTTFSTDGIETLDIGGFGATPRTATVLSDGSILGSGYLTDTADANIVKPVVWKVSNTGVTDTTFGGGDGYFHQKIQGHTTEVYGAALQGDKLVTVGYGKETNPDDLDWVSLRLNLDGTLDSGWGTAGVVLVDRMGFNDNARSMIVLPDNRILLVGGGRSSASDSDAMIAMLTATGALDTTFGNGGKLTYDFGGASDFFWGAAVSPSGNRIAIVGTKQVAAGTGHDDGALIVLPLVN